MIDYDRFQFATAPRTGSTWFLKAAVAAGLGEGFKAHVHQPHTIEMRSTLRLSLVRHPCDWLASYFTAIHPGSCGVPAVDRFKVLINSSFDLFVRTYLRMMSGAIGEMFASYNADTFLRIEDMPWAMAEFLDSIGVSAKQRDACITVTRQNPSKTLPIWNPRLRDLVMEAEREMVERYDYH